SITKFGKRSQEDNSRNDPPAKRDPRPFQGLESAPTDSQTQVRSRVGNPPEQVESGASLASTLQQKSKSNSDLGSLRNKPMDAELGQLIDRVENAALTPEE